MTTQINQLLEANNLPIKELDTSSIEEIFCNQELLHLFADKYFPKAFDRFVAGKSFHRDDFSLEVDFQSERIEWTVVLNILYQYQNEDMREEDTWDHYGDPYAPDLLINDYPLEYSFDPDEFFDGYDVWVEEMESKAAAKHAEIESILIAKDKRRHYHGLKTMHRR